LEVKIFSCQFISYVRMLVNKLDFVVIINRADWIF